MFPALEELKTTPYEGKPFKQLNAITPTKTDLFGEEEEEF